MRKWSYLQLAEQAAVKGEKIDAIYGTLLRWGKRSFVIEKVVTWNSDVYLRGTYTIAGPQDNDLVRKDYTFKVSLDDLPFVVIAEMEHICYSIFS